jgi:hypothetical protein
MVRGDPARVRTWVHRATAAWLVVSAALLVAPAFGWWGNYGLPLVFGLPWSLAYVLALVTANALALALAYAAGVGDDPGPDELAEAGAQAPASQRPELPESQDAAPHPIARGQR